MKATYSEIRFNHLIIRRLSDNGIVRVIPLTKKVQQ